MKNEASNQNLYEKGYQLYTEMYQDFTSKLNFNRPVIDEKYYQAMPLTQLTQLANQGDAAAQYCLADYYAEEDQMELAMDWYQRAANGGCAEAMEMLAGIYGDDAGSRDEALEWLKKASKVGCSAYTAYQMVHLYLDHNNSSFEDYENALPWLMLFSAYMQSSEEEAQSKDGTQAILRLVAVLQVLIEVKLEVAHNNPALAGYQEIENHALMCYYFAQKFRISSLDSTAVKTAHILCQIGECAYGMRKPYGKETLKEAMSMGSDYAAVLLVPEGISKACNERTAPSGMTMYRVVDYQVFVTHPVDLNQVRAANSLVKEYFPMVRRAATSNANRGGYRQAEALYRLSHFYIFGFCCRQNLNTAHYYLEQAANLGHTGAKHLLEHFHKKFLSGWRIE